ncbi:hypothetical protein [Acetobacter tropicalis]|uniref:hypothetical protein n=1 Tax=Acetobacter tropicalis TaxID=104102 RepID=UPI000A36185D|nr:hypothetical protein [Acetobacter tropicalis]
MHRAYRERPSVFAQLARQDGAVALATRFLCLTAALSGKVHHARQSEIDLEKQIWIIPAERIKSEREHRVPLTASALNVLRRMEILHCPPSADGLIFSGGKIRSPLAQ